MNYGKQIKSYYNKTYYNGVIMIQKTSKIQ